MLVRRLKVRLDELVIADRSGRVPTVQTFKVGLDHDYTDITEMRQLLTPAALQCLLPVGPILRELVPGALGEAIGEVVKEAVKSGGKFMERAGLRTGETSKAYFDALEESKKP